VLPFLRFYHIYWYPDILLNFQQCTCVSNAPSHTHTHKHTHTHARTCVSNELSSRGAACGKLSATSDQSKIGRMRGGGG